MAKIDKFLEQMETRGASLIRLDPGEPAIAELPGGHRINLGLVEMTGPFLDGVVKEILPEESRVEFMRGAKVTFEHLINEQSYQILCCRTPKGTRMVAARSPAVHEGGEAGVPLETLEPLIFRLLNSSGSDLYLNADAPPLMRVNGQLEALDDLGLLPASRLEELVQVWVPPAMWEAYAAGLDPQFSHHDPALPCRLRVSLLHDHPAPALAIRVIPRQVPDADTLGLPEAVRRVAGLNKGLVLLTGPMGSGKSTTLACLLQIAHNIRKAYLITIQDAVEFEFGPGTCIIRQREVAGDPRHQKQAIRAAICQAPDILVVGEIRDAETLDLAMQAVHTGRLVLGTLTTASIMDTLFTLAESYPPEHRASALSRLGDTLTAIMGHTLLPRIGGGQVAALETLFNNPALAALIKENRMAETIEAAKQSRYGQVSHDEALVELIQTGKVEPRDAYLRCHNRQTFIAACLRAEIAFNPRASGQVTED